MDGMRPVPLREAFWLPEAGPEVAPWCPGVATEAALWPSLEPALTMVIAPAGQVS